MENTNFLSIESESLVFISYFIGDCLNFS